MKISISMQLLLIQPSSQAKMFPNNRILYIYLHLCLLKQVPCKPWLHLMQIVRVRLPQFLFFFFLRLQQTQQSFFFFPGNVLITELVC